MRVGKITRCGENKEVWRCREGKGESCSTSCGGLEGMFCVGRDFNEPRNKFSQSEDRGFLLSSRGIKKRSWRRRRRKRSQKETQTTSESTLFSLLVVNIIPASYIY
uniref:Uncharacterized protein n=1 Tax=Cacopsylla melanoneura TaxID=428564 RepID=A0A8D9BKU0_9HEMI